MFAIETHIVANNSDAGSRPFGLFARWCPKLGLPADLFGMAGEPFRFSEDATLASALSLARRVVKELGPDGIPYETLQLVGGKTVARTTAVLERCRDISANPLPKCWAESCLHCCRKQARHSRRRPQPLRGSLRLQGDQVQDLQAFRRILVCSALPLTLRWDGGSDTLAPATGIGSWARGSGCTKRRVPWSRKLLRRTAHMWNRWCRRSEGTWIRRVGLA